MATQNDMMGTNDPIAAAGDDIARAGDNLGHEAHRLADQAKDRLDSVRDQAMTLKDQALDQARSAAEEGKSKAAEAISGIAQAARDAAGQIGQNPSIAPVGKYGEQAADALERFASTLRNKEVDALMNDVAGLVRRNPAIAAGVAVAVGYALSRMLRSGDGDR